MLEVLEVPVVLGLLGTSRDEVGGGGLGGMSGMGIQGSVVALWVALYHLLPFHILLNFSNYPNAYRNNVVSQTNAGATVRHSQAGPRRGSPS